MSRSELLVDTLSPVHALRQIRQSERCIRLLLLLQRELRRGHGLRQLGAAAGRATAFGTVAIGAARIAL